MNSEDAAYYVPAHVVEDNELPYWITIIVEYRTGMKTSVTVGFARYCWLLSLAVEV